MAFMPRPFRRFSALLPLLALVFALSGLAPVIAEATADRPCCEERGEADFPCGTSECPFCQVLLLEKAGVPDIAGPIARPLRHPRPSPSPPPEAVPDPIERPPEHA